MLTGGLMKKTMTGSASGNSYQVRNRGANMGLADAKQLISRPDDRNPVFPARDATIPP